MTLAILGIVIGIVTVSRQSETPIATTTLPATSTTVSGLDITNAVLTRTLKKGMRGEDVRRVQQRLKDLHFDPGPIDGVYGGDTITAIWAFQALVMKMTRDTITDFVTPILWDTMRGSVVITPRRTESSPTHVEIYLPEQAMVVFKNDAPILITHISSGSNLDWCEEVVIDPGEEGNTGVGRITDGACGKSITPGGVYAFICVKVVCVRVNSEQCGIPCISTTALQFTVRCKCQNIQRHMGVFVSLFLSLNIFRRWCNTATEFLSLMASKSPKPTDLRHRISIVHGLNTRQQRRLRQVPPQQLAHLQRQRQLCDLQ